MHAPPPPASPTAGPQRRPRTAAVRPLSAARSSGGEKPPHRGSWSRSLCDGHRDVTVSPHQQVSFIRRRRRWHLRTRTHLARSSSGSAGGRRLAPWGPSSSKSSGFADTAEPQAGDPEGRRSPRRALDSRTQRRTRTGAPPAIAAPRPRPRLGPQQFTETPRLSSFSPPPLNTYGSSRKK